MHCSKCGSAVGASNKYCSKCGATIQQQIEPEHDPVVVTSDLSARITSSFHDPTKLTIWLNCFLYASITINAMALFYLLSQYQLLTDFKSGIYTSKALATAAAESNDKRLQIIGIFQFVISIMTAVLFCVWIHRANFNARQLGAKDMTFTPGWAVGWYFIPFANLFKPYQAMEEIWKASKNPDAWQNEQRGAILPWWWFSVIMMGLFRNVSVTMSLEAKGINELLTSTRFAVACDLITISAIIIAVLLVRQIYGMQMAHAQFSVNQRRRHLSCAVGRLNSH